MDAQSSKLAELHALKSVKAEITAALVTDCETFEAIQQLQIVQSRYQALLVEFNFLRENYEILSAKSHVNETVITRLQDLFGCARDGVLERATALYADQEGARQVIFELEKTQEMQRSLGVQDLSRSVKELLSKYHEDGAGALGDIFDLKLNSEKIIRDADEVLE
ncbi:hypothetical protein SS50377_20430 [Spironucleus salmonicida]|uniref:Uncharacterized protein n=1 Tax=Spironucleus salmonicida TaxID=348837 RepID=V6LMY8_9EUKA|nr:hypothetical protein SS50377_20430 [Spironucleus salmonicida]|eukprot:EST45588.1 Hypothetical protein SS50377_14434 [Spironucleus salmonicida]